MKRTLLLLAIFIISKTIFSQIIFGEQQLITKPGVYHARSVYAADLDGDGDNDVLSASSTKIAWYENTGNGNFGIQQLISANTRCAMSVYAIDLDGDGDNDVLSASYDDNKIAWYENNGNGNFSDQQVITNNAEGAYCVYAIDLDNDGDNDVLSASFTDNKILILFFVDVLLLLLGMIATASANIVLVTPLLLPMLLPLGVNPIHLGVVIVFGLVLGIITPPVGTSLYILSEVAQISYERVVKAILIFYIPLVLVLFIITYVPQIVLFLPKIVGLMPR